jgi:hypothetical protein
MSFSKTNADHIDTVIACILQKFAGQTVHNKVLKDYLCATLPELFPSGRADGAVEFLSTVAFRSTVSAAGIGGVAFLEGIKDGAKRYWKVPMDTSNTVAKSDLPMEALAPVIPTRKVKLSFGEYVAAAKAKAKTEPTE